MTKTTTVTCSCGKTFEEWVINGEPLNKICKTCAATIGTRP